VIINAPVSGLRVLPYGESPIFTVVGRLNIPQIPEVPVLTSVFPHCCVAAPTRSRFFSGANASI
jgi:hypothetical protein